MLLWNILTYCTLKFMFSKKATKNVKIFTVNLTLYSKCQLDSEDFVNFGGLLRKHKLYLKLVLCPQEPMHAELLVQPALPVALDSIVEWFSQAQFKLKDKFCNSM